MSVTTILARAARRILDVVLVGLILLVLAILVIARGIPALTHGTTFVVGGGSMEPTIPLGSAVVALPVEPHHLAVGDIVSVQVGANHAVFTHRITRLVDRDGALWFGTRGDANADADPSIVPASAVIGRVGLAVPLAGYGIQLLSTPQGVVFLVAFGILVLACAWLVEGLEDDLAAEAHRRRAAVALPVFPERTTGTGLAS